MGRWDYCLVFSICSLFLAPPYPTSISIDPSTKKITWNYLSHDSDVTFTVNIEYKESAASTWIILQTGVSSTVKEWTILDQLKQKVDYIVRVTTIGTLYQATQTASQTFTGHIKRKFF